jgi:hypothetical protein
MGVGRQTYYYSLQAAQETGGQDPEEDEEVKTE